MREDYVKSESELSGVIKRSGRPVVGIINIGPWTQYGDANSNAISLLAAQKETRVIINGGYWMPGNKRERHHRLALFDAYNYLSKNGFKSTIYYTNPQKGCALIIGVRGGD